MPPYYWLSLILNVCPSSFLSILMLLLALREDKKDHAKSRNIGVFKSGFETQTLYEVAADLRVKFVNTRLKSGE